MDLDQIADIVTGRVQPEPEEQIEEVEEEVLEEPEALEEEDIEIIEESIEEPPLVIDVEESEVEDVEEVPEEQEETPKEKPPLFTETVHYEDPINEEYRLIQQNLNGLCRPGVVILK